MKKKIQKQFSIQEWKNGAKIETRCGNPVRILCADIKGEKCPIVAAVDYGDHEDVYYYHENGFVYGTKDPEKDLVIVEEVEVSERWADKEDAKGEGWYFDGTSAIHKGKEIYLNDKYNYKFFASEKLAKASLAMARISQLMVNDERYGGVVTDEEWKNDAIEKQYINREGNEIDFGITFYGYYFLAFHTYKQRNLFWKENERLVRDYLMLD